MLSEVNGPRALSEAMPAGALLLDLEVSHQGKLLKVGAVLGERTLVREGPRVAQDGLKELAQMAQDARFVLGHNMVRHDLAMLRDASPKHPLLRLPVVDTLVLSPLAFPENPYHRLVKDYKLVSESVNDPVADARQAAALFGDELRSLHGLRQTEPGLFEFMHYALATPGAAGDPSAMGMALVFEALGGALPSQARAVELYRELCGRWGCSNVPIDAGMLRTSADRLAAAYTVTWLRVAGSNSILPPWVRLEYPGVSRLITLLREVPCASSTCAYCRRVHDAREQLRTFFGLDDFRALPANALGGSLQRDIVEAGMRGESILAILPTGGGKSLCYQLPALVRNFRRGTLTVVISPLQALMKDQVDGLVRRTGTAHAAALYGLLTMPERADVLRRIRMGDVALLYISPEQLRNRSFREAIALREIGCWVFDEAHCLSKWGHDFRPDYLYAARFIREFAKDQGVEVPAIACFTATAKRDVKEEILEHFRTETARDLSLFEGGIERENLRFEVQTIGGYGKFERLHDLLSDRLPTVGAGSAIVFRATREAARETSEYLQAKGWAAACFHAGLNPPEKKRVQDDFLSGAVRVICATNAFGMGIDKEDVRLVVHADTPGSLENYLQEAGRAGRDGRMAECILLYDEEDCERQFRMGAFSELSRRDIAQILRGVRRAARGGKDDVVITSGEILRDEEVDVDIDVADASADTKVRTAIAWLERAGFIERNENVTTVFQARLLVHDLAEAETRMKELNLSTSERELWLGIVREIMNTPATASLTVDGLALLPEFVGYAARAGTDNATADPGLQEETVAYGRRANHEYVSGKILRILRGMAQAGLMKRDTLLTAFVRHGVVDHSGARLQRILQTDRKLVEILMLEDPDPEGWLPLSVRAVNQRLCDEDCPSTMELVRLLLQSLSEDGRGFAGSHGSLDLRLVGRDVYRVRLRRSWSALGELAERRRRVAALVLEVLLGKIPAGTRAQADLLVEFSFEELHDAIERDLLLRSELKDIGAALERGLMFLHEQRVIVLQQGLAVFRSAMTIKLRPEAKGERYQVADYQPLRHHYQERVLQVHVMSEYARRGLERIREALSLVLAYFSLDKETFIRSYLGGRTELLEHATTARSYQKIVTELDHAAQIRIVTAPVHRNLLILAGPGSGKTRTVIHRCAWLLRVERVRARGILVCCFNRQAALELRRRLVDLVGSDARGVLIQTYHGLALRLLGRSLGGARGSVAADLEGLIPEAVALLRGAGASAGVEPDEVRDRLLGGFQHILVDEYQDIDEPQYELISAIAGRTSGDADQKLSILAVGDDDQSIYGFRGANVEFIRRFQRDYDAEVHYLVENFRSTRHIIAAANHCIAGNRDRMKTKHPIRIDRHRKSEPAGGAFGLRDEPGGGRVQVIEVGNPLEQAAATIAELGRLRDLGVNDWSSIAVLARQHQDLARVRAMAEPANIPVRWWADRRKMPTLHHVREIHEFLRSLEARHGGLLRASWLLEQIAPGDNPWRQFLRRTMEAWQCESGDAELPVTEAREFLYEACAEGRREFSYGVGVTLGTVHSAKGTEYDHVVVLGPWPMANERKTQEEERRALYVGMTRARLTLSVVDTRTDGHSLVRDLAGPWTQRRRWDGAADSTSRMTDYSMLGLEDIHLGYPGLFPTGQPVHAALNRLQPGDLLTFSAVQEGRHRVASQSQPGSEADELHESPAMTLYLQDRDGTRVARLARGTETEWLGRLATVREVRVVAMIHREAAQDPDAERRGRYRTGEWEVPLVEVVSNV
jgi:ATP-dependent DNA helicase RecQ